MEPPLFVEFLQVSAGYRDLVGIRLVVGGKDLEVGDVLLTDFLESFSGSVLSASVLGGEHEVWDQGGLILRVRRREEVIEFDGGCGRTAIIPLSEAVTILRAAFASAARLSDRTGLHPSQRSLEVHIA